MVEFVNEKRRSDIPGHRVNKAPSCALGLPKALDSLLRVDLFLAFCFVDVHYVHAKFVPLVASGSEAALALADLAQVGSFSGRSARSTASAPTAASSHTRARTEQRSANSRDFQSCKPGRTSAST